MCDSLYAIAGLYSKPTKRHQCTGTFTYNTQIDNFVEHNKSSSKINLRNASDKLPFVINIRHASDSLPIIVNIRNTSDCLPTSH